MNDDPSDSVDDEPRSVGTLAGTESGGHTADAFARYVDFFEHAAVPMHWVGPDGTVLHANQAELDALGYSRDEYVGHHIAEFHADQEVIDDILDRLGSDEELNEYEARMVREDGSIRNVLIDSSVNWDNGEFVNTRCVTRDITERKQHERELERQNDRLEEFASIVSHDIRTPLSVAKGRLELAREADDNEHLQAVARAHDRIDALIEDLLSLARAGESVVASETVDLEDLSRRCWETVATGETSLTCESAPVIRADESRLRQLLENLISNAVEHGGQGVTITVGSLEDGFFVEDDGRGIDASARDRVFAPGYSTADNGTGIGLSTVWEIADGHGWEVSVNEGESGGARFEFRGVQPAD